MFINDVMDKGFINLILASFILLLNILLFLPYTVLVVASSGGPMGFAYIALPLFLLAHLFTIPSIRSILNRNDGVAEIKLSLVGGAIFCIILAVFILNARF